jgi:hypothetical protein
MKIALLPALCAMLLGCDSAPTGTDVAATGPSATKNTSSALADKEVKAEKKSIEEAADAAAKLVEEETNAEIDALRAE